MAKSNVIDLTGLTYEQAARYAKEKGKKIAHIEWPAGEYAIYDTSFDGMTKVCANGNKEHNWSPSTGEAYGGCAWACLMD